MDTWICVLLFVSTCMYVSSGTHHAILCGTYWYLSAYITIYKYIIKRINVGYYENIQGCNIAIFKLINKMYNK